VTQCGCVLDAYWYAQLTVHPASGPEPENNRADYAGSNKRAEPLEWLEWIARHR